MVKMRLSCGAGKRKNVAYDTLEEAQVYAKFACAAYAVVEYEDTR